MDKTTRPEIALYHANAKGTGSAMKISITPACVETGNYQGWLNITIAMQKNAGTPGTFPRFDWEDSETVRLGLSDIGEVLLVFRGDKESVNDGKGLLTRENGHTGSFHMTHRIEPANGFVFEIVTQINGNRWFTMTMSEAVAIQHAIEGALSAIAFGVPRA